MARPRCNEQHGLVIYAALEKADKISCKPFGFRRPGHHLAFQAHLDENPFQGFQVGRIQGAGSMFMGSTMSVPPNASNDQESKNAPASEACHLNLP
ncbi:MULTISPECIES: hypothetical protein [unclassified Mesorhizobium]|uniref:hypothetical protein n=1 Tax=unclassified Mesorhizobium TaxID=325217 RepID=UPI0011263E5A|nr:MULTISPECIES: hypothetical protein [unclassified Mesorhizobium]TPM07360.1 hypothetical protein FJ939_10050 [Mesorhizobium sp. B2-3-8]TPM16070.1 hypothetical protein FJ940_11865 [Mesorhizobium sp. B2-3-7]